MNAVSTSHKALFKVLGIPVTANSKSWQFIPPKLIIGIIVALIAKTGSPMIERAGWGLIYGLLLM